MDLFSLRLKDLPRRFALLSEPLVSVGPPEYSWHTTSGSGDGIKNTKNMMWMRTKKGNTKKKTKKNQKPENNTKEQNTRQINKPIYPKWATRLLLRLFGELFIFHFPSHFVWKQALAWKASWTANGDLSYFTPKTWVFMGLEAPGQGATPKPVGHLLVI